MGEPVVAIIPSAPILDREIDRPLFTELKKKFSRLKEMAEDEDERERKRPKYEGSFDVDCEHRFELALSTLLLAESEIAHLRNGISELEALLLDEDIVRSDVDSSDAEDDSDDTDSSIDDIERSADEKE